MNQNDVKIFDEKEPVLNGVTDLPIRYLLKALFIKARRKLWSKYADRGARLVWTVSSVSDAVGPSDNVRNYLERKTIRSILSEIVKQNGPIQSACEVGCGYGRVIMVLKEFADKVAGFEREPHLINIAKALLPEIDFYQCDSLDKISQMSKDAFNLVMTCTVLQHLTDDFCRGVLREIKRLAPQGYVLLIEKTEAISVTNNISNGDKFISRARDVELYKEWMKPYVLITTRKRIVENTHSNKSPGTCMLFKSSQN